MIYIPEEKLAATSVVNSVTVRQGDAKYRAIPIPQLLFQRLMPLVFAGISVIGLVNCKKEYPDYRVEVRFVDSTFVIDKESYLIGDVVYISAFEHFTANMPETVEVIIESGSRDFEIVQCWPRGLTTIPEIDHHCGSILTRRASGGYHRNNDTLELIAPSDIIWVEYKVKNQTAVDSAGVFSP